MWSNIRRCYPPFIDVLSFSFFILSIIYILLYYGTLPDEIPRYFNIIGEPDAWIGKGMLFGLLILYGLIFLMEKVININGHKFIQIITD